MLAANPYIQYQQNAVNSAEPGQLTLMLYNGAIKFTKQAIGELKAGDIEKANHYNIRVQDIITELMITLNQDYQLAQNLHSLYDYIKRRLIEANIKKDEKLLAEVLGMLEELRNTWAEALKKVKTRVAEG
jgi:flagellar protein FliS